MYSESDIEGAVTAGVLSPDAAQAFRDHVAAGRLAPAVDEEQFRLLTGFNDIFVAIAIALVLAAVAWIGGRISPPLGGFAVAAVAWGLAEYFTRQRRMALPSILLVLAFAGGVAMGLATLVEQVAPHIGNRVGAVAAAGVAVLTVGAAWLHWWRFMVPITVAAGALAGVGVAVGLTLSAVPEAQGAIYPILLVCGVAVFALAMRWDMSDRLRQTRRSDVAFWLHLAAAPLIAHTVFQMLGIFGEDIGAGKAVIVIALYLAFAFVALAVDRRALLVSSLVYVLYAMYALFTKAGAVELSAAFTALVIGSALLTLSAFWHPVRSRVVATLGSLGDRLPPAQALAIPQPA